MSTPITLIVLALLSMLMFMRRVIRLTMRSASFEDQAEVERTIVDALLLLVCFIICLWGLECL